MAGVGIMATTVVEVRVGVGVRQFLSRLVLFLVFGVVMVSHFLP